MPLKKCICKHLKNIFQNSSSISKVNPESDIDGKEGDTFTAINIAYNVQKRKCISHLFLSPDFLITCQDCFNIERMCHKSVYAEMKEFRIYWWLFQCFKIIYVCFNIVQMISRAISMSGWLDNESHKTKKGLRLFFFLSCYQKDPFFTFARLLIFYKWRSLTLLWVFFFFGTGREFQHN